MHIGVGFFDESTDEDTQGVCYVVAGLAGSNAATAILELRWRKLLTKYNLKYFKASELSAGEGEFKQYRDDPLLKKWTRFSVRESAIFTEIKTAFTDVIVNTDGIAGIGAALILPDYQNILANYLPAKGMLEKPYFLCSNLVLMEAVRIAIENEDYKDGEKVWLRPVFDSHEDYSGTMKQGFDWFCKNNPISARYLLPPYYEDERTYLSLQAADNLAFEIRKFAVGSRNNISERKSLKRMRESDSILKVYKLDYDALKTIIDARIDARDHESTLKPLSYTLADIIEP